MCGMTQFPIKVFILLCIIMILDIFYKYLKIKSKHLIAKKLAIYNFLTVLLEQKTFF